MRQRLVIIISLIVVVCVLIGLNAASYVRVEQTSDSEESPDRSTYNSGPTGTRALFDFLRESGRQVTRWGESSSSLLSFNGPKPATLVIVGRTAVPFSKTESEEVLRWVEYGGRLVIIDRSPDRRLLPKAGDWSVTTLAATYPWSDLDPANLEQMTSGVKPVAPSQPSLLTRGVETILPSRFSGAIEITPNKNVNANHENGANDKHRSAGDTEEPTDEPDISESPTPEPQFGSTNFKGGTDSSPAPAIHWMNDRGALLIDYPHGKGRVVLLSDPFIVANNGIGRADNLLLAINLVAGKDGVIAFDEFHQGRATTHNALIQYFEGTPVLAICGQLTLIGLAVIWSRGRRFARALPLPQIDRRSKLEFVASMAELQQRAKAHDLALENIYGRVRRALIRHAGLNNSSPRAEIATRVAFRSGLNRKEVESLMRSCEDTINGQPTSARESLRMARRLREIEARLGLGTRARDARQDKTDL